MLSVALLGDFHMQYDDAPVAGVDTPRLQSLLAYLLLHRDAPQSRAHLAYLFWPDTSEAQARTNLRNLLHHLRRVLPHADEYLDTSVQTLQWRSGGPLWLDVAEFKALLTRAGSARDPAAAREPLKRAVALYRGDLLPSCYDDWIIPHREELRQAYLEALERLLQILEEERDYAGAIGYAQRLLRHDPLHEATYRHLMRLHALDGDRAGALRVYHTCATVLQRELDVEPGAATRQAYEQLLGAEPLPAPALRAASAFSPLVGRDKEWAQMLQAWRTVAAGGGPHVVILCGEAGIGKTRLAEELVQWAARQGIASANARCYAAEGQLAYAPATAWLRAQPPAALDDVWLAELGRLLPEVLAQRPHLPRPAALLEDWQRQRLFEALSRAILSTSKPLLLTLDDLQWCDRDTLEWLHYLLRYDHRARLLLVGTCRTEEVGDGHALVLTLRALRVHGLVTEIDLPPLDEAATRALATGISGVEIGAGAAQLLYRETEGNPLFVVETVRGGLLLGEAKADAAAARERPNGVLPGRGGLPPKVRSVLQARLAQLSPAARELAGLAATIGREFSFRLLAGASGQDEDRLVRELDELWHRRIVREHGADGYDFAHDKLREVAYGGMSAARRRLLHRQVAAALETLHASELDAVSSQLAAHYERAGLAEQAAPYYWRAGELARRVYANADAEAHYRKALAALTATLAEPPAGGAQPAAVCGETVARAYEGLAEVLALTGRPDEARHAYEQALAAAPAGDRVWGARLQRRIGTAWDEENRCQEAEAAYGAAEAALGPAPGGPAPQWWREWFEIQHRRIWLYYGLGRLQEMATLAERSRPVIEQYATPLQRGEFLEGLVMLGIRRERYAPSPETLAHARAALQAYREAGDANHITLAALGLGFTLLWAGQLDEAQSVMLAGLEQTERSGEVAVQSRVLTYLTILYRLRGQLDQARQFTARSMALATERKMTEYTGMARASLSWLAWKEGNCAEAEAHGQAALALWQQAPLSTPFEWTARWPLLALALTQGRAGEAMDHAQAMLRPDQHCLPSALTLPLEKALSAWRAGESAPAGAHLRQALEGAQRLGYL